MKTLMYFHKLISRIMFFMARSILQIVILHLIDNMSKLVMRDAQPKMAYLR